MVSLLGFGKEQIDVLYVRRLQESRNVLRLSSFILLLKIVSGLSNQVDAYTSLDLLCLVPPFLKNFGRWGTSRTLLVKCEQRVVTCLRVGATLKCLRFFRMVAILQYESVTE